MHCPRCGEPLPGPWARTFVNGSSESAHGGGRTSSDIQQNKRSNRKVAVLIVGLMLTMAVGALVLALGTAKVRQSRHPRPVGEPAGRLHYAPAELPALGYLPADTNIAAGIHVASILNDKLARAIAQQPLPALLAPVVSTLEKRTGLSLQDIDHIVLGTTLKDQIPELVVVARSRHGYTVEQIRKLVPQNPIMQHRRPLFRLGFQGTGGGYLWCADERTLVMLLRPDAVKIEDMDRIPASPRQGAAGLPQALRNILETRLRQSVLWLAGTREGTSFFESLKPFMRTSPEQSELLKGLGSFGFGLLLQDDLTVIGAVEARSPKAARAWQEFLKQVSFAGMKSRTIIPAQAEGAEKNWLNLQIRGTPDGIRALLEPKWFALPAAR